MIYRGYGLQEVQTGKWTATRDGRRNVLLGSEEAALKWVDDRKKEEAQMPSDPHHSIQVRASTLRDWQRRSLVAHGYDIGLVHVAARIERLWPNVQPAERLNIIRAYRYPEAYHEN